MIKVIDIVKFAFKPNRYFQFVCAFMLLLFLSSAVTPLRSKNERVAINHYKFEELEELQKKEKRKVIVFIHASWCKFCLKMENMTFKDPKIITLINDQFYFVSFDGESREDVVYQGRTYRFKPNGTNSGIHELTEELARIDGMINYPSVCVLENAREIKFQYGGYMDQKSMLAVLNSLQ